MGVGHVGDVKGTSTYEAVYTKVDRCVREFGGSTGVLIIAKCLVR